MKKLKIVWKILKMTSVDKIIGVFFLYIIVMSCILKLIEPTFHTIGDGIWYCFVTFTTVGFGDLIVTTVIGKILSIILMLYGMIVVAFLTGTLVNFYQEMMRIKAKDNVTMLMDKMERLPELSKEELIEISDLVKKKRYKV